MRNTPTPVGKTTTLCRAGMRPRKHPHACGEDGQHVVQRLQVDETPPRLWGRLHDERFFYSRVRNTPTPVGKTSPRYTPRPRIPKHPHACGEDFLAQAPEADVCETPPRLWGRPVQAIDTLSCNRNTPTPVGKTANGGSKRRGYAKHPHACGEDGATAQRCFPKDETPPRLWGRRPLLSGKHQRARNTPTPVGKTRVVDWQPMEVSKHPHACGEDKSPQLFANRGCETPPRLWGRRFPYPRSGVSPRNTPTPVGKTLWPCHSRSFMTKHPHACGED